jgi:uncharacterized protein
MKIDVSDLLKSLGAVLKVEEEEKISLNDDDIALISPVRAKLKLVNTGATVLVSGSLKTTARLDCSRCLKKFDMPVDIDIEEEYVKGLENSLRDSENEEGAEIELKDKDMVFEIDENNIIDLDEAIRQNILVSLPIKPLCSETCKLPVASSGKNKKIDPRLEKLKNIKITGGK